MEREYFKSLESLSPETPLELGVVVQNLALNDKGLIPVITQDASTREVLMFAWMNEEALYATLSKKYMTYWSRSRQQLWVKGETSGHYQALVSMSFDCDGDVILCMVNQTGAACHTGRNNCFYLLVDADNHQVVVKKSH